jgi:ribosome-associated protein
MNQLDLIGDYITLAQALKAAGLADNGGHAKQLVREGAAVVNGEVEARPGRKLRGGDRFCLAAGEEWVVA